MEIQKPKYDGWIVSDNFFKRALAIYGHNLFANLFIFSNLLIIAYILNFI